MTTESEPERTEELEEAYKILVGVNSETTDRLEPEIREDERQAREEEQERRDDAEGRGETYNPEDWNGNGHGGLGGNNGTSDRTEDRNQQQQQEEPLVLETILDHLIDEFKCKTLRDDNVRNLEILYYNPIDGCYHRGGEVKIREELEEISDNKITEHMRKEIVHHVKYSTVVDREQFDSNPNLLHFSNGYYNLATNHFEKGHTPDYLSIITIPHNFDPKVKCHKVNKCLTELLPPERIKTIIKMWGYCLLRTCEYQKAFMLYGKGKNGKGVIIRLTRGLLGEENCSSVSLQDIGNSRFAIQRLDGKMANTYGDLPQETIRDTSKFKSLVDGGEALDAEKKFHDPYTFKNKAKLVFSANKIPDTDDKSFGYYRRWVLVYFERVFDAVNDVKGLGDTLIADENEMTGLINLALIGLRMLRQDKGFEDIPYEEVKKNYEEGGANGDLEFFINDCYIIDPLNKKYETRTIDFNNQFDIWCEQKGIKIKDRPSDADIKSFLTLHGVDHRQLMRNHERSYYYVGLKLKKDLKSEQNTFSI